MAHGTRANLLAGYTRLQFGSYGVFRRHVKHSFCVMCLFDMPAYSSAQRMTFAISSSPPAATLPALSCDQPPPPPSHARLQLRRLRAARGRPFGLRTARRPGEARPQEPTPRLQQGRSIPAGLGGKIGMALHQDETAGLEARSGRQRRGRKP